MESNYIPKTYDDYLGLVEKINYHNNLYYNQDSPEISDYEYDMLSCALRAAEASHPEWVSQASPTQKVGGEARAEAGIKVVHDVPMLSIMDVFSKEDVARWIESVKRLHPDCTFSVETKIDGLSATIRYKKIDGVLSFVMCETRGDGFVGEDVSANAEVIDDIKKSLPLDCDELQLRGEVYVSKTDFLACNKKREEDGKKLFANPRNLAAGTLRTLDPEVVKERGLKMFVFNVQKGPNEFLTDHTEALDTLSDSGVPVVYHEKCSTADEVMAVIDKIAEMRASLDYDIDGAVVKLNEVEYRADVGGSSKYSCGHIAYKYPPEEKIVVMDKIEVDVGRTGKLTFTGIFHDKMTGGPACLCGTSVTRATLHNQDYINNMTIGIGGEYRLVKSGEIIPKLMGCVKEPKKVFKAPSECPFCKSKLQKIDEDTVDIYCTNPECVAKRVGSIIYFASKSCLDIIGLGETMILNLAVACFLDNYADIYRLKDRRKELIELGLIGKEKNTDKILAAIEKSKQAEAYRVLAGLGIPDVGASTAKEIMKHYDSIDALMAADVKDLTAIPDVGDTTALQITRFFENKKNVEIIHALKAAGVNMSSKKAEVGTKFAGQTIVITGTLTSFGRKEAAELIETNGGKCSGSVSKKTSFVLAGEAAGSKLDKAKSLGIKIVSENEFIKILNE